jgi:hypothetical protein
VFGNAKKRIIWALIGLVFAIFYGLWTASITGGGHGNFIWLWLFIFVEAFGLYFPFMSFLAADLRSWLSKIVFGSLICFNLLASIVLIIGWVNEPHGGKPSDFSRMVQISGIESVVFFAAVHFLPTMIFVFLLIKALIQAEEPDDDQILSIGVGS